MRQLILIGFAGFVGTVARFGLSEFISERAGSSFPWGTLVVNVIGCFLAGFLFCILQERTTGNEVLRAVLMVGFLGGLTTFSAFGLQTFALLKNSQVGLALLNLLVSNLVGLAMVWAGYSTARLAWA
jgi:CrcB protein